MPLALLLFHGCFGIVIKIPINTIILIGILIQKTHCQLNKVDIIAPHRGPITAPASAEAPVRPIGKPLLWLGYRSLTIAIETGTNAPAPIAWITLVRMTHCMVAVESTKVDIMGSVAVLLPMFVSFIQSSDPVMAVPIDPNMKMHMAIP